MPGDGLAAFERWRQAVTSAAEPAGEAVDWDAFESSIGLRLPSDYKAYIDAYGVGSINELLRVRHPTAEKGAYNLIKAPDDWNSPEDEELYRRTHLTMPPLPLGVGRHRLMLCADGEGGQLYWNTTDDDPDRWPVVLGDTSGQAWIDYDLTMIEFLLALFTGQLPDLGFEEAGYVGDEIVIERG
jgi:hypothetical protein